MVVNEGFFYFVDEGFLYFVDERFLYFVDTIVLTNHKPRYIIFNNDLQNKTVNYKGPTI